MHASDHECFVLFVQYRHTTNFYIFQCSAHVHKTTDICGSGIVTASDYCFSCSAQIRGNTAILAQFIWKVVFDRLLYDRIRTIYVSDTYQRSYLAQLIWKSGL